MGQKVTPVGADSLPRHITTLKNLLENLKRSSRFNESVKVEFVAEWIELVLSEWAREQVKE